MKIKLATAILALLAATQAAAAEEITVAGLPSPNRGEVPVNTDISNTLKLDSSAGTQYKIAGNTSFGSVSVVNGENPGDAYSIALGSLTVDINSASGSANAFSANNWWMLASTLNFKNSVKSSEAVANINFAGNLGVYSISTVATQKQSVTFTDVKANVTVGGTATIGNGYAGTSGANTSAIYVNSSADVTWTGTTSFGGYGQLNVNGKFATGGAMTFGKDSELNVNGSFTSTNAMTFDANSNTTIGTSGNVNLSKFIALGNFTSSGKLTQTTEDGIGLKGTGTIKSGSEWLVKGKLHTYTGSDTTIEAGASVMLNSPNPTASTPSRLVLEGGKITFNSQVNSEYGVLASVLLKETTLAFGTDFTLAFINQLTNDSFTIVMNEGGILRLIDADSLRLGTGGVIVHNFAENKIYVGTNVTSDELALINLFSDAGETYLGTAGLTSDGWLTAVPEPAEWAAIFGAAALAFAICRRRK